MPQKARRQLTGLTRWCDGICGRRAASRSGCAPDFVLTVGINNQDVSLIDPCIAFVSGGLPVIATDMETRQLCRGDPGYGFASACILNVILSGKSSN